MNPKDYPVSLVRCSRNCVNFEFRCKKYQCPDAVCCHACLADDSPRALEIFLKKADRTKECRANLMAYVMKGLERFLEPLDVFVVMGIAKCAPKIFLLNSEPQREATIEDFERQATPAKCGLGDKKVLEPTVRKVLQTKRVRVEFAGLDEVLQRVQRDLIPNAAALRAEFHQVLFYRPGDFFKWHLDSKKAENHVATLAVDTGLAACEGGELCFRNVLERTLDTPHLHAFSMGDDGYEKTAPVWASNGVSGSYACWFNSQPHAVKPVTLGNRIVVIYNICVDKWAFPDDGDAKTAWLTDKSVPLSRLSRDLINLLLSMLDFRSIARLRATCRDLRAAIDAPAVRYMQRVASPLFSYMKSKRMSCLGWVLRHRYSFDGADQIDPVRLRGQDLLSFIILTKTFRVKSTCVEESVLLFEQTEERRQFVRARVCKHASDLSHRGDSPGRSIVVPPALVPYYHGMKRIRDDEQHYFLSDTELENDYAGFWAWPYLDVLWMSSLGFLEKYHSYANRDYEKSLWGNGPAFSCYWFKDASCVLQLAELTPSKLIADGVRLNFSADIK